MESDQQTSHLPPMPHRLPLGGHMSTKNSKYEVLPRLWIHAPRHATLLPITPTEQRTKRSPNVYHANMPSDQSIWAPTFLRPYMPRYRQTPCLRNFSRGPCNYRRSVRGNVHGPLCRTKPRHTQRPTTALSTSHDHGTGHIHRNPL